MSRTSSAQTEVARNLILIAAIGTPIGIALAVIGQRQLGAATVILSVACALFGLHRFGRTGTKQ